MSLNKLQHIIILLISVFIITGCSNPTQEILDPIDPELEIIGFWDWCPDASIELGDVEFNDDFTMKRVMDNNIQDSGIWVILSDSSRTMQLNWESGFIDQLTMSSNGENLSGTNQDNSITTANKR